MFSLLFVWIRMVIISQIWQFFPLQSSPTLVDVQHPLAFIYRLLPWKTPANVQLVSTHIQQIPTHRQQILLRTAFAIGFNIHFQVKILARDFSDLPDNHKKSLRVKVSSRDTDISLLQQHKKKQSKSIFKPIYRLLSTPRLWMSHLILTCMALISAVTIPGLQMNPCQQHSYFPSEVTMEQSVLRFDGKEELVYLSLCQAIILLQPHQMPHV